VKVELRDIHKHYGPVKANDGISLVVEPGTIHGILGENGAGKSTLMKVLSGFLRPDSGTLLLDGRPAVLSSPAAAIAHGVGMLHQDPLDFAALSVLDNFLLGSPGRFLLPRARARRQLAALATALHFRLDPRAAISALSVGERQQLEIVRLLWLGVQVLILDEPTTAISAQQKERLFSTLRQLAGAGKTILFVSHKLQEVEELCDRVTVLARGQVTCAVEMPCPTERLVQMMFGQAVELNKRPAVPLGPPVLELDGLTVHDWRLEVRDLSLSVRAGEVIGLAGLEGSGQRLVLQACAGLRRPDAGRVKLAGREMAGRSYGAFLDADLAYMPPGRLEEGLIPGMNITEHVALAGRSRDFLVDWNAAVRTAAARIAGFNIKGRPETCVEELSGGNQQRMQLGLLPPRLRVLLMEHPTRGLDLESSEYIWDLLQKRTEEGTAILFASADLDELLDRSDRILIFCSGKVAVLDARQSTVEQLGERIGGSGFGDSGVETGARQSAIGKPN
jgi:simple sugar transport system ATP-binding protein